MLTLFYAPGACSLAPHIALEEAGAKYTPRTVNLAGGEQRTDAYKKINPLGRVPVLGLDDGSYLTENVAILPYIARSFPAAKLLPTDPLAEARCQSFMGFLSSSVHVAHAHIGRPERYTTDESDYPAIKAAGLKSFHGYLQDIDKKLEGKEWLFDQFTVCDGYAFVMYTWGVRRELPMSELKAFSAHKDRMLKRPAVQRVLEDEKIKLN